MTLDEFAARLDKARPCRIRGFRAYKARCPGHEDNTPSLGVWEGPDGWLHVKCLGGCDEARVLSAMGLETEDRRVAPKLPEKGAVATYVYTDAQGHYLFEKHRKAGKGFVQLVAQSDGSFLTPSQCGLNGKAKTLYRLPEVARALQEGRAVYVNEGEKAVEACRAAGLVATCQPGGASPGKWLMQHVEALSGADVVIVADRDETGEDYAREVYTALASCARSVRVVQSATTAPKDDAWDHFAAGFGEGDFVRRADLEKPGLSLPRATEASGSILKVKRGVNVEASVPRYLWEPYLKLDTLQIVDGRGGSRKSTMVLAIAAGLSRGVLPGGAPCPVARTLYVGSEDDCGAYKEVFERCGGDPAQIDFFDEPFSLEGKGAQVMAETVRRGKYGLLVLDPLKVFLGRMVVSELDTVQVTKAVAHVRAAAEGTGCAWLGVSHWSKAGQVSDMTKAHAGAEAWRNSVRGVLSVCVHPERPNVSCLFHTKGGLQTAQGQPVALCVEGRSYSWLRSQDVDWSFAEPKRDGAQEGAGPKAKECAEWLAARLSHERTVGVGKLRAEAEAEGFTAPTLYKARDLLGLTEAAFAGRKEWSLAAPDDPFDQE